jgi:cytoskeletal protein RodZ
LLRDARIARGLTVLDAEQDTRIRRRHLESVEADDLLDLPPPVFTRGLVRTYARWLGVDESLAMALLRELDRRPEADGVVPTIAPDRIPRLEAAISSRTILAVIVLVAAAAALYFLAPYYQPLLVASPAGAQMRTPSAAEPPAIAVLASPTAALPMPTTQPSPTFTMPTPPPSSTAVPTPTLAPEAVGTATVAASLRGVTMDVRPSGRVWLQVESDTQVVFSGVIMPGDRRSWRGDRVVSLHVGDAALVDVQVNGRAVGALGAAGEVIKKEWTAQR